MNKQMALIAFGLLLSSITQAKPLYFDNFFDSAIAQMEENLNHFKNMQQSMRPHLDDGTAIEEPTIEIDEQTNPDQVLVTINNLNIKENNFDASLDYDRNALSIKTPAGSIILRQENHFLSVGLSVEVKQETEKDKQKNTSIFVSHAQTGRTLGSEIIFNEHTKIDYDPETKAMTILIPVTKKNTAKIPVSIKQMPNQE
jgi:hypothetical protein